MKKPYVIVNCAMSADGKIALPNKKQIRLSSDEDIARVHRLRNKCDAILVGVGTILSDDPKLTVKRKYVNKKNNPIRVILDSKCRTPIDSIAVNKSARTLIFSTKETNKIYNENVEVIKIKNQSSLISIKKVLENLAKRGIKKLMVEGGGTVIFNFLREKLVDDLYVYISPKIVGGSKSPTMADGKGIYDSSDLINLKFVDISKIGEGILLHFKMI